MHSLLDESLVGVLLLASVLYALFTLGPRALRARMMAGIAAGLGALPGFLRLGALTQRLEAAATNVRASCGGCDSCAPAREAGSDSQAAGTSKSEIAVPVDRIGRR